MGIISDLEKYQPICNGLCLTGADIGVGPMHLIAYAHPECELHSDFDPDDDHAE